MRNELQAKQAVGDYTKRHKKRIYQGQIGSPAGTVNHPQGDGWIYVQLHGDQNQLVKALNAGKAPSVAGVVVDLEKVERTADSYYQVIGLATNVLYVNNDWHNTVAAHADQHQRRDLGQGGFDPLDIYNRALVNLRARAQATPDLTVYVERGFYFIGGALYEWTGGNSAAFTVPAGSFGVTVRRCDLLYIGSDQALHIVQGATTSDGSVPAYPTTPYPCIPVAYVYLASSTTSIQESNIKDARVILTASDGTPTAHNLLSATHGDTLTASVVAGDVIIGNDTPKWSRLAITVPAPNVRNVFGVDNGETKPSWKAALDGTAAADIAAAGAAGTSLVFSHRDHAHRGVVSVNKNGDTTLYGAVTLSAGANVTLTQVGQDIAIASAGGGGAHDILSATHTDTLADTVVAGDIIIGNATPKWARLAISVPAANILNVVGVANGETLPSWKALFDATNPADTGTAAPGTSLLAAHRDHVHALATPGTLTASTTNSAVAAHTHAITSSSNPGEAASLLATDASGYVTIRGISSAWIVSKLSALSNWLEVNPDNVVQATGHYIELRPTSAALSADYSIAFPGINGTVTLGAGTLTVATTNDITVANHTHAITSSSNPGAAAAILASDASGLLQLVGLGAGVAGVANELRAGSGFRSNSVTGMRIEMRTIANLTNGSNAQLLNVTGTAAGTIGFIFVIASEGTVAMYDVDGGQKLAHEGFDPWGVYTPTATTASSTNLYYSNTNGRYEIENNRGVTLTYNVLLLVNS